MNNDQEILDNAPEGATHYVMENGTNFYFKIDDKEASIFTDEWDCYTNHKDVIPDLVGIRSLADIKRIVELEKQNAKLIQAGCDLCFYTEDTEEYRLAREKFPCRYD